MDHSRLMKLAERITAEKLNRPDEENLWRAEMQAAGVPEELQEVMVDLLKELHGALGAEGWFYPVKQSYFLVERLWHYMTRLREYALDNAIQCHLTDKPYS